MRLELVLPFGLALFAQGLPDRQVWEKPLAPGVTYRMERDRKIPREVHALRVTLAAPGVEVKPVLTGRTVYDAGPLFGRGTTTALAREYGAPAAINADFFPLSREYSSGDPLGVLIQDGKPISIPYSGRAVFAWGADGATVGVAKWAGAYRVGAVERPLDGLNQECPLNATVLNTPDAGLAVAKAPNAMAVLRVEGENVPWGLVKEATVETVTADGNRLPVPKDRYVLVGQGEDAAAIAALSPSTKLTLRGSVSGFDGLRYPQAIGGGPLLLQNGQIRVTAREEGFPPSFSDARHPRTAVGVTPAGDVWLVVVDGRTAVSRGATLLETAELMRKLGCRDAINLDGGGSSVLSLFGAAVNRPSDGAERPIASGIVVRFPVPAPSAERLTLRLQRVGNDLYARALQAGRLIPAREIVWSVRGPATVDGDGRVRRIAPQTQGEEDGQLRREPPKAYVRAAARGQAVETPLP